MPLGPFFAVFSFLKELVFGRNSKHQRSSIPSKLRKWLVLIILIVSLFLNYQSITRLFTVTKNFVVVQKENKILKEKLEQTQQCEASLQIVREWLKDCVPNPPDNN